ncbi:hypothetical protein [Massilia pseudoviolaceinigra]|nr:hypothetical protein [Massilia sp. CCM 9206]MDQ1924658.1 hypothetical protein [Massilia sp. CCM 9206]
MNARVQFAGLMSVPLAIARSQRARSSTFETSAPAALTWLA